MSSPHRPLTDVAQTRSTALAIVALLALAFAVRVPGIGRPLLGDFATKNVVYAMIARNWVEGRASLFRPTLDALAGGERSWHLLELPLPAYVSGICWQFFGGSLDAWGRALTIIASGCGVVLLYLLAKRWHGETVARAAAALLALAPVSIIYGQSFMLEAWVAAFSLGAMLAADVWCERRRPAWLAATAFLFGLLLLTKIYMAVLALPLIWNAWRCRDRISRREILLFGGVLMLALLPAMAWYGYAIALSDPAGDAANRVFFSVRDSAATHALPHPLLSNPSWYARVLRNLATVVLTPVGALLLVVGFAKSGWRRHAVWIAAYAVLALLLPRKFHELNYYYLVALPPLCLVAALGWERLTTRWPRRHWQAAAMTIGLLCACRYAIKPAFVTPREDAMVVDAGRAVQSLCAPESPVVTMHGSGIDLLYYCNRPGWAIAKDSPQVAEQLDECRAEGAELLAVAQQDQRLLPAATQRTLAGLPLIAQGNGYRIYRLGEATTADLTSLEASPSNRR